MEATSLAEAHDRYERNSEGRDIGSEHEDCDSQLLIENLL